MWLDEKKPDNIHIKESDVAWTQSCRANKWLSLNFRSIFEDGRLIDGIHVV